MSDPVAKLLVTLGMDSAEFTKGAKRAADDVSKMRKGMESAAGAIKGAIGGMVAAFTVDKIIEVAKAGLDYASSLGEQAQQLGVTTRALQEYRYAASQAGVETEQMDMALAQLTKRIGAAATGSKKEAAAFKALGVDIRDANGHIIDAGDAIPLIAEGLKKIDNPATRAKYLVDLFGRSGQLLAPLLAEGAAGVNGLRDAAHKLGIVLDDAMIQKADAAADKMAELKQVLEAKIAVAVSDNADSILELVDALAKLVEWGGKAVKAWNYFSRLDWTPIALGGKSISAQFAQFQMDDLGPPVELTMDPRMADALPKPKAAPRRRAPTGTGVNWGSALPAKQPFRLAPPVGWPTTRAVGGMPGGFDLSAMAPGLGASDWIRTAEAAKKADVAMAAAGSSARKAATSDFPQLEAATGKLTEKMAGLRDATQNILDRLFPEQADQRQFASEMAVLDQALKDGQLSAAAHGEAIRALRREYLGLHRDLIATAPGDNSFPGIETVDGTTSIEDIARDEIDRVGGLFEDMADRAETANVRIVGSMAQMVDGTLGQLDRLTRSIKSGDWLDTLGAVLSLVDGIAQLATDGKGFKVGAVTFGNGSYGGAGTPGFATGGAMKLGGLPGVDTNLLSLNGQPLARVSAGETMHITPANDRASGGEMTVRVIKGDLFDVVVERKVAGGIAASAPALARMGGDNAIARIRGIEARTLGRR